MLCLIISGSQSLLLCLKTGPLIDRIIQLGVSICHLPSIHKELKTFYIIRIVRFLFCQWRDLNWVIHNKGRLDQMILYILLKEQVQDIPLLMTLLKFNAFFLCQSLCCLSIRNLVKINSCVFLDGIYHRQSLERLGKIHLMITILEDLGTCHFLGNVTIKLLGKIHHTVIICIRLIKLHQCELRIMSGIQSLITEHTTNLVNTFHATYDQSLEIQLQRYSQFQILIQGIEVSLKWSCSSTAGIGYQHRCLHLHKALLI